MPTRRLRSRTLRKVQRRTPGARTVKRYLEKKTSPPHCGSCGTVLSGVPRGISSEVRKLTKSQRRPERPYGGVLCSKCMRATIIKKVRQ